MVKIVNYPSVILSGSISFEERQAPIRAGVSIACNVDQNQQLRHWESPSCHAGDLGVIPSGGAFAFDQPNMRQSPQPSSVPASLQHIMSHSTAPWDR